MSGLLGAPRDVPVSQNDAEIEGDADPSTPAFTSSDLGAKQGVSATIAPQIIGVPGLLGAPREVPVWRNDAEIEGLAKFAVEEHNKKENALLEFARVVKAKEQTVVGTLHHLTIEAVDAGKKKIYEAQVWVKSWENFKQLKEFNHVGDADPSTPPEWQGVPLWARVSPSYSGIPYVSSFYLTRGEPPEGIKMEYVRGVGRPAGFVHSEFDQAVLDQMRAKKEMIDMEFRARFPNGGCRWCHQEVTHSRLVCPVGKKLVAYPLPQACVKHA